MGRSRSASLVVMYVMYKFKVSADEAFNFVQSRRSVIDPNKGFRKNLYEFEEMLKNGYKVSRKKKDGHESSLSNKRRGEDNRRGSRLVKCNTLEQF